MKQLSLILALLLSLSIQAQLAMGDISLATESGTLYGTLTTPPTSEKVPVVLIIAGSGPTDRDGNNPMMKNNSLKMIAEALLAENIACLRYDKRGIAASKAAGLDESALRFDHYVADAKAWVALLKKDPRFSEVIILGHSEGSLIGMLAAQEGNVSKYISVAGVGAPAADVLRTQLSAQPPMVMEMSEPILAQLEQGKTVAEVPAMLNSLFRPSVQPYMISWFKYNPALEIAKLKIPTLIVQGSTDIQVGVENAEQLAAAKPDAKKLIIEGMNHVLKEAPTDRNANIATYSQPDLPLHSGLVKGLVAFIKAV